MGVLSPFWKCNLKIFQIAVLQLDGAILACSLLSECSMRTTEKSVRPPAPASPLAGSEAESLLGEFRALLGQVGLPGFAAYPFWTSTLDAPPALGQFLEDYLVRLLVPCELPAIVSACGHARRGELRELLAHDQRLAALLLSTPFATPSRRMGWLQLARLRPLRDERFVQRYLAAVESGQAHGWHTIVFGVTLAVFSLPLRQGLLYYSHETLCALAAAATRSKGFGPSQVDDALSGLLARVPDAVEEAISKYAG
jgi:urease accessory protein UreF